MSGGEKMTQTTVIERLVLQKLLRRRKIHTNQIKLDTLLHCGFKPHERGEVKKAVKSLIQRNLLVWVKRSRKTLAINKDEVKNVIHLCVRGD